MIEEERREEQELDEVEAQDGLESIEEIVLEEVAIDGICGVY